jgi:hypothetical protein
MGCKERCVSHVFDVIIQHQVSHLCTLIVSMSQLLSLSAQKRRKHSKYNAPLHEDDDEAIDTVTHTNIEVKTRTGRQQKRVKVPLVPRVDMSETSAPDPISFQFGHDWDPQIPDPVIQPKNQRVRENLDTFERKLIQVCADSKRLSKGICGAY